MVPNQTGARPFGGIRPNVSAACCPPTDATTFVIGAGDRAVATTNIVSPTVICSVGTAIATTTSVSIASVTVSASAPRCPSLATSMIAVPVASAATNPVVETVATEPALETHVTERPARMFPPASLVVTVGRRVWPISRLADCGLTCTIATGAGPGGSGATTNGSWPRTSPMRAITVASPGPTAVTTPFALTIATAGWFDDHAGTPMLIAAPCWSNPAALAVTVRPTSIARAESETAMVVSTRGCSTGVSGVVGAEDRLDAPPPPQPVSSDRLSATSVGRLRGTATSPSPARPAPLAP